MLQVPFALRLPVERLGLQLGLGIEQVVNHPTPTGAPPYVAPPARPYLPMCFKGPRSDDRIGCCGAGTRFFLSTPRADCVPIVRGYSRTSFSLSRAQWLRIPPPCCLRVTRSQKAPGEAASNWNKELIGTSAGSPLRPPGPEQGLQPVPGLLEVLRLVRRVAACNKNPATRAGVPAMRRTDLRVSSASASGGERNPKRRDPKPTSASEAGSGTRMGTPSTTVSLMDETTHHRPGSLRSPSPLCRP